MSMIFRAWTRGLLLSSLALSGVNVSAVEIGGFTFAENAFSDRVLSTDFTGDIVGLCGATPSTIDDAVTGQSFDTLANFGDHDMFAGADGDYNVPDGSTPPNRYLEFGFVDNAIVNLEGPDLVLFEQGSPPNAFRVALDKFSIQNPYLPGAESVVAIPGNGVNAGYCVNPRMAFVDLSDFGIAPGASVYRVFVSSALLENGDVAWNNPVNPSWGVPEILAVAALNSEDKGNYPPEVELGDDVIVSLPNMLALTSDDIDVIDDSTPNVSLTYAWTQTDGVAATISSVNTLATTITFPESGNYTFRLTVTDGSLASASDTLNVQVTAADNTPPSTPANFAAEVLSNTGVSLTWSASTDNVAIKQYNIYRDDALLTSTTNLFYKDFRVEPGSEHDYFVRAVDPAGNLSVPMVAANVTLSARLLARRVAATADNAEEHADGVVVIGDGDLELVEDGAFGAQTVGLRFQNITVPAGATIVKAWLDFQVDEISAEATSLTIHGISDPDLVPFSAAFSHDVSNRGVTDASVAWNNIPAWSEVGAIHAAPDMAAVVQELIGNGGWASGQAMGFVITGTGRRVAEARDNGANDAPRLFIEYQAPAPVNQPPAVSAGVDQDIELPIDSVSLEGTVTDDNLTGVLTLIWSAQSGPGTVTFSAPDATATDATFSQSGTYVLRLTASDGEHSPNDEVTVVVSPQPNRAPAVDVGADRSVSQQNALVLSATVTDDGISGQALTYEWTVLSGPGSVIFDPDDEAETSVTFSQEGSYELQLTVNDGELSASDTLMVTVSVPDLVDPSQPLNLNAEEIVIGTVELTWDAATDNVAVVGYNLYRDNVLLTQVNGTTYTDTGLTPDTEFVYQVSALDAAENESARSAVQSITTEFVPDELESMSIALTRYDGVEQAQSGTMSVGAYPIDLVYTSAGGAGTQQVGLRFNDVTVPSRARIARAYLRFCAIDPDSGAASLNFAALDEADAEVFGTEAHHLSGRATIGNVAWNNVPAWADEQCYDSPDITLLAQLLVNNEDWRSGNSMGFKITGSGSRRAYRGGTTNAPRLILEYFGGNLAPVVNAGSATSVRLPNSLALSGSAIDDDSSPLTNEWSPVRVPRGGIVTFVDTTSVATSATFNVTGDYTLRLTVSDGEKSGYADVIVTVLRANQAPVVNAGSDRTVTLPNTVELTTNYSDDGATEVTVGWTKVSGPDMGFVEGSAPNRVRLNFSAAGEYVVRLTADDGQFVVSDDVTITVNAASGGSGGGGGSTGSSGSGGGGGSFDLWSLLILLLLGGAKVRKSIS